MLNKSIYVSKDWKYGLNRCQNIKRKCCHY
ncbi:hypothetical protein BCEN4_740147 [Burkholderia cenocepacia]|nr:hypothetical protein BCEN4_740147 [Burkholderia cenocepacia]